MLPGVAQADHLLTNLIRPQDDCTRLYTVKSAGTERSRASLVSAQFDPRGAGPREVVDVGTPPTRPGQPRRNFFVSAPQRHKERAHDHTHHAGTDRGPGRIDRLERSIPTSAGPAVGLTERDMGLVDQPSLTLSAPTS